MIPRVMAPGQSVDRTLAGRRGSWKNRLFPFCWGVVLVHPLAGVAERV